MELNRITQGAGPALLIAHGLFGSARNWGVIAKRLSDTFTVTTVDMRNHGDSPWSEDHSYTRQSVENSVWDRSAPVSPAF